MTIIEANQIKEMQDNLDRVTLELVAYQLIEAIHGYTLNKNLHQLTLIREAYNRFIIHCSKLVGENLNDNYKEAPVYLIRANLTTQWIIGLVKAIKEDQREQIDSCGKSVVQIMKGNLYV